MLMAHLWCVVDFSSPRVVCVGGGGGRGGGVRLPVRASVCDLVYIYCSCMSIVSLHGHCFH